MPGHFLIVVLITSGLSLAGQYGLRLPSIWILSGAKGAFAHALENVLGAVTRVLSLLFFTFFSVRLLNVRVSRQFGSPSRTRTYDPSVNNDGSLLQTS